ncbi:MAG: glycosyltransferase family 87 protein [Planctomycetota bacterium]
MPGRRAAAATAGELRRRAWGGTWNRMSWAIGIMLMAHLLIGTLLLLLPPDGITAPYYSAAFGLFLLQPETVLSDSWDPMLIALEHARSSTEPLYQTIFFDRGTKFQYPPSSLLIIELVHSFAGASTAFAMNVICWGAAFSIAVLSAILHLRTERSLGVRQPNTRRSAIIRAALVCVAALAFYPLARSFKLGQVQTLLTLLVTLAMLAHLSRRQVVAGLLLGCMTAIKPYFILIVVWALVRKHHRVAIACVATAACLQIVAVLNYGLEAHLEYVDVVQFMGRHGEVFHPNQSVNGLANRIVHPDISNLEWRPHDYAPFHPLVYALSIAATVIFMLLMILPLPRREQRSSPTLSTVDLGSALLALTLASPIAWEHHHSILIPVLAIAVPVLLSRAAPAAGRFIAILLVVIYLLAGQRWTITDLTASIPVVNIVQSYLFFASVTLLVILLATRRQSADGNAVPVAN